MGRSKGEQRAAGSSSPRRSVKRQVVSVRGPGVEVVSEEKFARRLEGMSGCGRRGKQGRRRQSKANTPIVIHIQDTLQSAMKHRQRSLDTDSDSVSVRSTDEDVPRDIFGDVSSIPEFIPKQCVYPAPACPPVLHRPYPALPTVCRQREKSKKNLTALISVIEKGNHEESCHTIESNLAGPASRTCSKLCHLLNNEVCSHEKSLPQQRSIADCENIDVICNDLYEHEKRVEGVQDGADTDSVSDKSSVSSSGSEAVSDHDSLLVEESAGFEFSPEELQRLAEYTTGYPIYRYDCAPSDCPQCLSMWYYHHHQASYPYGGYYPAWSPYPCDGHTEGEHDTTLEASEGEEEEKEVDGGVDSELRPNHVLWSPRGVRIPSSGTPPSTSHDPVWDHVSWSTPSGGGNTSTPSSSPPSTPCSVTVDCSNPGTTITTSSSPSPRAVNAWSWTRTRQLWDIDISHHGGRDHPHLNQRQQQGLNPYPNSVFLDLTGTDVSISVYYHDSLLQDPGVRATLDSMGPGVIPAPTPSPLYSLCYQGSSLLGGLPLPLSLFSDRVPLPRIAMVPPPELTRYADSQPPPRKWMRKEGYMPDYSRPAALFRVMCYNVLCDKYCTRQQYGYCPSWALSWEYRKKGLLNHILDMQSDIISLQEVETEQYDRFFKPELARQGYSGLFLPKSRVRTMSCQQERQKVDGCAIFYKKDKFQVVEYKEVEFNQLAMANAEGNEEMYNRVMTKDNIGLIALLQTKPGILHNSPHRNNMPVVPHYLVVATAHIHWDPEYSDVKMVQTVMLMSELQAFVKKACSQHRLPVPGPFNCNSIPMVLCGDLNSLPDSGVVEFLSKGCVATNHVDFKDNVYDVVMKKLCKSDRIQVYHDFQLERACGDIMPFTNYTYDFKGVIDYIFHTKDQLRVVEQLGPYEESWFRQNKVLGCPNPHIPSDHFSLVVTLEMPFHPPLRGKPMPPPPGPPRPR
ncbi:uncharacterized protein LOC143292236 [Babylonia areolata]|uniref:uncharacterized protein LOC143292236 n=1 Tax=Babylonia areolata TaxID=304850 RepID=UPI003FD2B8CC